MIDLNSKTALADRINWLIDAGIDAEQEAPRDYLGCSVLGGACERAVQFEALGALRGSSCAEAFSPRIKRVFQRGHDAEARAAAWLRAAGFVLVTDIAGAQFEVSFFDGKVKGHADGILTHFIGDDCPIALPALWECKCVGAKYWREAVRHKVKKSHPQYLAQMQLYMGGLKLTRGLITMINADTLELHHELIEFGPDTFAALLSRAERILLSSAAGELLPRGKNTPDFICKMCRFQAPCWQNP